VYTSPRIYDIHLLSAGVGCLCAFDLHKEGSPSSLFDAEVTELVRQLVWVRPAGVSRAKVGFPAWEGGPPWLGGCGTESIEHLPCLRIHCEGLQKLACILTVACACAGSSVMECFPGQPG
jgi:hypothetical protein